VDATGDFVNLFGRKGDAAGDFALPRDVAFDSDGHVYVLDNQFENVQVFDRDGRLLMAFGEEGAGPGRFSLPSGITIDQRDRIWIADTYNRRVQVFEYLREEE
jgi:DNA-binding beta-propeller fold protein YncE